jgi:hypothetical protein
MSPVIRHMKLIHLAVLRGDTDADSEVIRTDLGAGTEDEENLYWHKRMG